MASVPWRSWGEGLHLGSPVFPHGTWEKARWGHENWTGILFYLLLKFSTLATLLKYFHLKMEKLLHASGPSLVDTSGILRLSGFVLQVTPKWLIRLRPAVSNRTPLSGYPAALDTSPFPIGDNLAIPLNSAKGGDSTRSDLVRNLATLRVVLNPTQLEAPASSVFFIGLWFFSLVHCEAYCMEYFCIHHGS